MHIVRSRSARYGTDLHTDHDHLSSVTTSFPFAKMPVPRVEQYLFPVNADSPTIYWTEPEYLATWMGVASRSRVLRMQCT